MVKKNHLSTLADSLKKKDVIDTDKQKSLQKMASSSDKESKELAKEIIHTKVEDQFAEGLNEGQKEAFYSLIDFLKHGQDDEGIIDAFVLKGYAGTGKTFLVKRVIECILALYPSRRIAVTAPTNKAVKVLHSNSSFTDPNADAMILEDLFTHVPTIVYTTVHRLLGLKERISSTGKQMFEVDKRGSSLDKYNYLIVDEVSMLNDELCMNILDSNVKTKIIFMGDPAQIPPIGKKDCIPFRDNHGYRFKSFELTEIMRQKGDNPIIEASFILRENLTKSQPIPVLETKLNDNEDGITYYNADTSDRQKVRPMLQKYFNCKEFKNNTDYAKVIAWRNATVNYVNSVIRELLYGEDIDRFVKGEKIIANKPIFSESQNRRGTVWILQHNTSDEFEVINVKVLEKFRRDKGYSLRYKIYDLKVKGWDPIEQEYFTDYLEVVHPDSKAAYDELLDRVKQDAIKTRDPKKWVTYFNIMKWSANLAYNYAITAHKSQGSTYQNVLIMEDDLDKNSSVIERNRIKYTAYSRASNKLFILRKNYKQNVQV